METSVSDPGPKSEPTSVKARLFKLAEPVKPYLLKSFEHIKPRETYWITRFIILRGMGFVYLVAFYVAAEQLVPLVGENGLTPAHLFLERVLASQSADQGHSPFLELPTVFWFDCSDTALRVVPWLGVILSLVVLCGYANSLMMFVLWVLYLSIVGVGQDWYGYGWEIQMSETGFLVIFLCPWLDARPFPARPAPVAVIFLLRWLIVRIMLGSALIKLRGDSCWQDLTALYYHFETQPIPNPISRYFHFLPHPILQCGVILTFLVELVAPFFAFWPRWGRYIAGILIVGFQLNLIISGNLSFFNWLTILPALACFDDRFWRLFSPKFLANWASQAQEKVRPSISMLVTSLVLTVVIGFLSLPVVENLFSERQAMNTSYDPLHLVNTYGAFGTVGRERAVLVIEGTNNPDPNSDEGWQEYPYQASPWDPKRAPRFIAPYQPHLDWQLWFAAMDEWQDYPWTLNLIWKLLHNDPAALSLMGGNPFPDQPPHYIRVVLYKYHFAPLGNPDGVYWNRERLRLWLPPLDTNNDEFKRLLRDQGWIHE